MFIFTSVYLREKRPDRKWGDRILGQKTVDNSSVGDDVPPGPPDHPWNRETDSPPHHHQASYAISPPKSEDRADA